MAEPASPGEIFDLWRKQFEEGAQAWARLASQPQAAQPLDPMAFWRSVLDQGLQTWAGLFARTPVTPDLAGQWKQFLDEWIEAWSKALGQAMATDAFAGMMGRFLDQWLTAQGRAAQAADPAVEAALQALKLPSRGQVIAIAKQLAELEEGIERLEDGIHSILRHLGAKEPS